MQRNLLSFLSGVRTTNRFSAVLVLLSLLLLVSAKGNQDEKPDNSSLSTLINQRERNNASPNTPQAPQEVGSRNESPISDVFYIILIVVLAVIGITAIVAAGICWYRHTSLMLAAERVLYRSSDSSVLIRNGGGPIGRQENENPSNGAHQLSSLAKRADYPAYGITGPNPLHENPYEKPVDGVLSKNAEVYHYHQTKKRMKALSSSATSESGSSSKNNEPQDGAAELSENDEETSDGEYTVYECSGFAAAIDGPMEVRNPLFDDVIDKTTSPEEHSSSQSGSNGFHLNPSYQGNPTATSNK